MCTKHKACSSQSINAIRPAGDACNAPKIAQVTAISSEQSADCCDSESSCCASEPDEPAASGGKSESDSGLLKSWKVVGMDCPACARKVESATNKLAGVVSSKVLFATEKLVVRVNDAALFTQVEAAVVDAGFTLNALDGSTNGAPQDQLTGWKKP